MSSPTFKDIWEINHLLRFDYLKIWCVGRVKATIEKFGQGQLMAAEESVRIPKRV